MDTEQTLPLTRAQFEQLIEATYLYDQSQDRRASIDGQQLRTLLLVMRWTGLRITDVILMARANVQGNQIHLITRKTGAHYSGVIPDQVVQALREFVSMRHVHPDYYFWSKKSQPQSAAAEWTHTIQELNHHLSLKDESGRPMRFRSHMLRDTFAVELLLAGVALEDVSRLLTHSSIKVTEKHYNPWIRPRQEQLQAKLIAAMRSMGQSVSAVRD